MIPDADIVAFSTSLEPLVEKVDRAHRHQLHLVVLILRGQVLETLAEEIEIFEAFGFRDVGSGGVMLMIGFTKWAISSIALPYSSCFRVESGVTGNLATCLGMIIHAPEVISIWHRRERAVEWKNF